MNKSCLILGTQNENFAILEIKENILILKIYNVVIIYKNSVYKMKCFRICLASQMNGNSNCF